MPQGQADIKIAISGANGFIGSSLISSFRQNNITVVSLMRRDFEKTPAELARKIEDCNYIINLAGAPVNRKWTILYKKEILSSRVNVTRKLVRAIGHMNEKPELFISTSAVGIYDSFEVHDEFSTSYANDFLSKVCQKWEAEAVKIGDHSDVRLCIMRLGVVLGNKGGAFPKLVKPFRYGLGAKLGDGHQVFPFIHIEDLISAVWYLINRKESHGIYNLVAPQMISNLELTEALNKKFFKSIIPSVPVSLLRFFYGEGAGVILSGQKVLPKRLLDDEFVFKFEDITSVIDNLVKKKKKTFSYR